MADSRSSCCTSVRRSAEFFSERTSSSFWPMVLCHCAFSSSQRRSISWSLKMKCPSTSLDWVSRSSICPLSVCIQVSRSCTILFSSSLILALRVRRSSSTSWSRRSRRSLSCISLREDSTLEESTSSCWLLSVASSAFSFSWATTFSISSIRFSSFSFSSRAARSSSSERSGLAAGGCWKEGIAGRGMAGPAPGMGGRPGPAPGRAGGAGCFIPGGNGGGSGFLGSFSFLSSIGIRLKIVFAPLYSTFSQFPFS